MSSEEWSQEFILDWWIDACLVRVALYLRWMTKDDTQFAQHIPKDVFFPYTRGLGQLTFLSDSLREGEDIAWGWKRCFSWGYMLISFCRNRRWWRSFDTHSSNSSGDFTWKPQSQISLRQTWRTKAPADVFLWNTQRKSKRRPAEVEAFASKDTSQTAVRKITGNVTKCLKSYL